MFQNSDLAFSFIELGGGLNDTSGPFKVADNESSDLQNIDFDKFGSIMPRLGYTILNTSAISTTNPCLGLYWFRTPTVEKAINVTLDKVYRMDVLDGTWDDITQTGPALSTSAEYQCDFTTFNSKVLFTNDADVPKQWGGSGSISNMTVVTGLTKTKLITNFQNYCLMANCVVSGVDSPTRIYWSAFKDETSWDAADFIEIGYNDGQEITGLKVLGDRLIVYKTKSIWFMTFTGNADIPFLRFKANASIGCVAPYSIQEVDNGHLFVSWDGLYFFDGLNAYKLSGKISNAIKDINRDRIAYARSAYQFDKNKYLLSVANSSSTWNNLTFVYDTVNMAFSKYTGMSASNMAIFSVNGIEERLYFADNLGYTYRGDNGVNDNPSNTSLAVDSYYYTNWKNFNDISDSKGIPHAYIYHSKTDGTLTFAYAYDFSTIDQYTHSFSMATTQTVSDIGIRRDLTGRGRVVRFKFANNNTSTHYVIQGIGVQVNLQSKS